MDWIKTISNTITNILKSARAPLQGIPPILLLCEIMNRPGMSAIALTGKTISKLANNGFCTGKGDCGMENMSNQFIKIVSEEVIKHIKLSAKAENAIEPMGMSFIGMGGNAGGPVVLTLNNNNYAEFGGIPE